VNKVAIFGNAGGGKSTLARRLAAITGLPLHTLDMLKFKPGGGEVPHPEYLEVHARLLAGDRWIMDGFGCVASAWERFAAADTLIHVDLPLRIHYAWVTKRLLKGIFVEPEGWPEDSPIWRGSMNAYRVVRLCDRKLTPRYRELLAQQASRKRVHHLRSPREIKAFLHAVGREYARG